MAAATLRRQERAIDASQRSPPVKPQVSRLPLHYFAFAHLSLATGGAFLGCRPEDFVGFFYHPRMMAPVHLVTLGWITASILGALYMIAPMALRTRLSETRLDRAAFWAFAVGVTGMVGHFWIDSYNGMLWSALMVLFALVVVAVRTLAALRGVPMALGVKLHLSFAFFNVVVVAMLGILLGLNRVVVVLPGYVLTNVYAHAHLAIFGWAGMMVIGVGYRLLPMLLPAAAPAGASLVLGALLLEGGLLTLTVSLIAQLPALSLGALAIVAGLGVFFWQLLWMVRNRRPRSRSLRRADPGRVHLAQALAYLVASVGLGLALMGDASAEWKFRIAPVYGAFLLIGFLAQMVVAVSHRLWPLYAWFLAASTAVETENPPPSPHGQVSLLATGVVLALWTVVTPLLALGFYLERPQHVGIAGWLLVSAAAIGATHAVRLMRRMRVGDLLASGS